MPWGCEMGIITQLLSASKKIIPLIIVSCVALLGIALFSLQANKSVNELNEVIHDSSAVVTTVYKEALASQMMLVADIIVDPLYGPEPATLNKLLYILRKYDVVLSAYILDTDENILADGVSSNTIALLGKPLPPSACQTRNPDLSKEIFAHHNDHFFYSKPIVSQGERLGRLQVTFSLDKLQNVNKGLLASVAERTTKEHQRNLYVTLFSTLIFTLAIVISIIFSVRQYNRAAILSSRLKESASRLQQFKLTLDQTLDCIFMFDPHTLRFIYVNQGAIKQIGYSMEELLSMSPLDIKPDFTEKRWRALVGPLLKGEAESISFKTVHRTKKGLDLPVEIFLQYITLDDGESRFLAIVHDISTRQAREQEKEHLQTQLLHAQKLESVGQLAAGIAHEINTPTQFVGTNIDFLEEASQDINCFMEQILTITKTLPQEQADAIAAAVEEMDWEYLAEEIPLAISQSHEGVKRASSIVRAMKEFSHPGSKDKAPQNLNDILQTTITVARNEWRYVADMELDLDSDLPQVPLLADEMGQVILNILVNAAHAIAEKLGENPEGVKGTITINTRKSGNSVELRIQDSGAGMPEKVRLRIFDPFYTTKTVGKGTGQGLAISHGVIVEKHQGTIAVESVPGEGTTFCINLPLREEKIDD